MMSTQVLGGWVVDDDDDDDDSGQIDNEII